LSLEELAKIPALFELGPHTDSDGWRVFWKEFASHRVKQEIAAQYGQLGSIGVELYRHPITPKLLRILDRLKQWGLYVDCLEGHFQSPDDIRGDLGPIIDYTFAAAEERVDSYAQFHVSLEQSRWFLGQVRRGSSGWPPEAPTQIELAAILLSQASRLTIAEVPNYLEFYRACEALLDIHERAGVASAVGSTMARLQARLECPTLQSSEERALRMFKLLMGFLTESMPEAAEGVLSRLRAGPTADDVH
jgi:hypothetical protein